MTLPKHKAAAYTEQIRQHGPMTTIYGEEKGDHPNRKVTRDVHTGGGAALDHPLDYMLGSVLTVSREARGGAKYHPDDDSPAAAAWREEERDLYPH